MTLTAVFQDPLTGEVADTIAFDPPVKLCQTATTVPLEPMATCGELEVLFVSLETRLQLPPNSFVADSIKLLLTQTATVLPPESTASSGEEAPDADTAVAALQLPLKGSVAELTTPFSSQTAVTLPLESIPIRGLKPSYPIGS